MQSYRNIFGYSKFMIIFQLKIYTFAGDYAKVAQLVEHDLPKVGVAGSSPVFRSKYLVNKKIHFKINYLTI